MHRYNVILVDGELAIEWEDETRAEAVDRARAGAARAECERRWTLHGARRGGQAEDQASPGRGRDAGGVHGERAAAAFG